jgi:hypothetical protein
LCESFFHINLAATDVDDEDDDDDDDDAVDYEELL